MSGGEGVHNPLGPHADTHEDGGDDEINLEGLSGDPADTINESLLTTQNDIIVRGPTIAERLNIGASRIVARLAAGNVVGATIQQILNLLMTTQNDIITRNGTNPIRLNIAASRVVARLAAGNLVGATPAQILALLSGEAAAAFDWNDQDLINTGKIRAGSSVWHHEHDLFATSLNPGASGATRIAPDSNTIGGWQLNASGETLYFEAHMETEWDAVSDLIINAWWEVNVDNTGGAGGDTVDLQLVVRYKGEGDTSIKTQTVEVATTVGASARYKQFMTSFTIDYDAASNVIDSLDILSFSLNLETDTSEVDDIILNLMELRYATTKPSLEA